MCSWSGSLAFQEVTFRNCDYTEVDTYQAQIDRVSHADLEWEGTKWTQRVNISVDTEGLCEWWGYG